MDFIARQEVSVGNAETGSAFDMTAIFPGSTSIEKIVEWSLSRYKSAAYGRLIITVAEKPTSETVELAATDSQHGQLAIAAKNLISGYDEGGPHVSMDLLVNDLRAALQKHQ